MPSIFRNARDPISSYTHFLGAALSLVGLVVMSMYRAMQVDVNKVSVISSVIFCLSLIALYSASSIYHFTSACESAIRILRKVDHAMIYVLIAGSYTPILLSLLSYPKALMFTRVMWIIAAAGILMKIFWINAPRVIGAGLYILMGWAILVDLPALSTMHIGGTILLILGGLAYTTGGVIYMVKRPNLSTTFGFHELFHIFVLIGSICHYFMVLFFIH